jgi:hypothetical protein
LKVVEPTVDGLGIALNARGKLLWPNMTVVASIAPLLQFIDDDFSILQVGRGLLLTPASVWNWRDRAAEYLQYSVGVK